MGLIPTLVTSSTGHKSGTSDLALSTNRCRKFNRPNLIGIHWPSMEESSNHTAVKFCMVVITYMK